MWSCVAGRFSTSSAEDSHRHSLAWGPAIEAGLLALDSHAIAFALDGRRSDRPNVVDRDIYVAMNAFNDAARIHDSCRALRARAGAAWSIPRYRHPRISSRKTSGRMSRCSGNIRCRRTR